MKNGTVTHVVLKAFLDRRMMKINFSVLCWEIWRERIQVLSISPKQFEIILKTSKPELKESTKKALYKNPSKLTCCNCFGLFLTNLLPGIIVVVTMKLQLRITLS